MTHLNGSSRRNLIESAKKLEIEPMNRVRMSLSNPKQKKSRAWSKTWAKMKSYQRSL